MTSDELTQKAKELAARNAPWTKDVAWWIVLIQGLIMLGIGLYILFAQTLAIRQVVILIGAFLLINSIIEAFQGFDDRVRPRVMAWHMFGAGVGFVVGLLLVSDIFIDFMGPVAGAVIVSFGLLLTGITGIIQWVLGGEQGVRRLSDLILPIGSLLLGGVTLWTRLGVGDDIIRVLGILATLLGITLLVRTFMLYSQQKDPSAIGEAVE